MTDLREYSSSELSNWVMNDEYLYKLRHYPTSALKEALDECFLYTDEQWDELQEDLEADYEESEA
jgi:hypothetical protein